VRELRYDEVIREVSSAFALGDLSVNIRSKLLARRALAFERTEKWVDSCVDFAAMWRSNPSDSMATEGLRRVEDMALTQAAPLLSKLKDQGNKAFAGKDCAGALRLYTEALQLFENLPPGLQRKKSLRDVALVLLSNRAQCHLKASPPCYTLAFADCDLALTRWEIEDAAMAAKLSYRRGQARGGQGEWASAVRDFELVQRLSPRYGSVGEIMGVSSVAG
jgi:hypothetical protein